MSNPVVRCTYCNAKRDPQHHMGGRGHPVDKAEKYLLRHCKVIGMKCNFTYRAGVLVGPMPSGQQPSGGTEKTDE